MKQYLLLFIFGLIIFSSCKTDSKNQKNLDGMKESSVSELKIFNYEELKPLLNKKNDSIYVINFWATWCKPCVEELPAFEKLNSAYANKNVAVLLVSLDFPKQIDSRVKPFIQKKKIQSKVVLLDDVNEDFWIKAISEKWSGAIPATLIYNKNSKRFYEQSFSYKTLETELQTFLN